MFGSIKHRINILEGEVAKIEKNMGENELDEVSEARLNALRSQLNLWYGCKDCY